MKRNKVRNEDAERNDRVTVTELPSFAPEAAFMPKRYTLSEELRELMDQIADKCREFLNAVDADEFNGSYFDSIIMATCNKARVDLDWQCAEHEEFFVKELDRYYKGSIIRYEKRLEQSRREFHDTEQEIQKLEETINRGTILVVSSDL